MFTLSIIFDKIVGVLFAITFGICEMLIWLNGFWFRSDSFHNWIIAERNGTAIALTKYMVFSHRMAGSDEETIDRDVNRIKNRFNLE